MIRKNISVSDERFLFKAIQHFKKKYPNALFTVVSNEISWSKKHLKGPNFIYANGTAEDDMATLVMCDHSIITVGTICSGGNFWMVGRMAGWGEVIKFNKYTWRDNYCPEHWLTIINQG